MNIFSLPRLALLAVTLGVLAPVATTRADTIVVNSTADPAGFNRAITISGLGSTITFRDAVNAAYNTPGAHTVTFDPSLAGQTIFLQHRNTSTSNHAFESGYDQFSTSDVTIQGLTGNAGVTIARDPAADSFGLFLCLNANKSLTINDLTLSGGFLDGSGYGGFAYVFGGADLTVNRCLITGNQAGQGGALYVYEGDVVLNNCTVDSNHSSAFFEAPDIFIDYGTLTLNHLTTTDRIGALNLSEPPAGFYDRVILRNCIVASTLRATVNATASQNNLLSGTGFDAGGLTDGVNGNELGVDAQLGVLADHGGPTLSYRPLATSPAIDAGLVLAGITTDQRGGSRPQGAAPDIGAVEVVAGEPVLNGGLTVVFSVGVEGSFPITASGSPAPTFSITGVLPSGVSLDPTTGVLSGSPAPGTAGTYPLIVTATNAAGFQTREFSLMVAAYPLLVTTATDEDNGSPDAALGTGCSLREAMAYAGTFTAPTTIEFAPALAGQILDLSITGNSSIGASALAVASGADITINGLTTAPGIILRRGISGDLRHFYIPFDGKLTLNHLTLADGRSDRGGAIYSFGILRMNNCTLKDNVASLAGGALTMSQAAGMPSEVTMVNCTIANNSAGFGSGAIGVDPGTVLNLTHVTLSGNRVTGNGGGNLGAGLNINGTATAVNCIFVNNTERSGEASNLNGTLAAGSRHNLVGPGNTGGLVNGVDGNLVGVTSPGIGSLGSNGGPTETFALLTTSPALNAGTGASGVATDQRGSARPSGSAPDIGAYEYQYAPSLVVTTAVDEDNGTSDPAFGAGNSLREALAYAASLGGSQTVTFAPPLAGQTITLGSELSISTEVTVQGLGASQLTISGGNTSRVFHVSASGVATLSGLTIANGRVDVASYPEGNGGGILNQGSLTLLDSTLSNNQAGGTNLGNGGGLHHAGSSLVVNRCTFDGNRSAAGGYGGGMGVQSGSALITNSTFSGNSAPADSGNGGAFCQFGGATEITNSTFSGNSAANGGAIIHYGTTMLIRHCTVAHNTATFTGGGIERIGYDGVSLSLQNNLIALNTAPTGPDAYSYTVANDGAFTSLGNNLIGNAVGALGFGAAGDLLGNAASPLDPLLGSLADNGGATFTHALLSGSPAINSGTTIGSITTDQRGSARSVGGTPDIGAVENETGDSDPDGDNLDNAAEAIAGTSPLLIDTDTDGYNDATEMLSGSNPTLPGSVPGTTRIERVLGFGAARGLDLSGTFIHAFNVGTPGASGQAGDATFTADNASGITVSAPNEVANWTTRDFGSSSEDTTLETVFQSIRWADTPNVITVTLGNLSPGNRYKLQLLFAESGDYNRRFDVRVDGVLIADDFSPSEAQGTPVKSYAAASIVDEFIAGGTSATILLEGTDVADVTADKNPILNGVTLEQLSVATQIEAWRAIHGLAADGSQDGGNPSGDGVSNLEKYAFNLAPNSGDLSAYNRSVLPDGGTAGLPRITVNDTPQIEFQFVRRKASTNPGIVYYVETCTDLSDPDWRALDLGGATTQSIDDTWERLTITAPNLGTRGFGRMRVNTAP